MDNVLDIQARVDTDPLEQLARQTLVVKDSQDQLRGAMEQLGRAALQGNAQAMKIVTEAYKENYVATQALKSAQRELQGSLQGTNRGMLELRQGAMLAGSEIGVKIPRALTSVAIRMPAIASAINTAFNAIVIVAFVNILIQVGQKIIEISSALGGMTAKMKAFYAEMIEANNQAFFGFTTSKQGMERLIEVNQRLEAVSKERAALEQNNLTTVDAMSVAMWAANKKRAHDLADEETQLMRDRLKLLAQLKQVQDQEHQEKQRQTEQDQRDAERAQREQERAEKKREAVVKKVDEEITKAHREMFKEYDKEQEARDKYLFKSLENELAEEKKVNEETLKANKEKLKSYSELIRANEEQINQETRAQVEAIKGDEQIAQHRAKTFTLSNADYIRQMLALEQQKYTIQRDGLQQRIALLQLDPSMSPQALARLNGQLEALEQQHQNAVNKIQQQATDYRSRLNQDFNRNLQSGFQKTLTDMASGNANFGKDVMGIFQGVENSVFQVLSNMLVQWISTHLLMKLIGGSTNAGQISSNAGVAASGAYASTAMIPIVGPELAPAAAATALAGAMSFESLAFFERGGNVAENQLAFLHKNEMVLPAPLADNVRQGNGGGHTFQFSPQVQALDATGVDRVLQSHQSKFIDFIKRAHREGHLSGKR